MKKTYFFCLLLFILSLVISDDFVVNVLKIPSQALLFIPLLLLTLLKFSLPKDKIVKFFLLFYIFNILFGCIFSPDYALHVLYRTMGNLFIAFVIARPFFNFESFTTNLKYYKYITFIILVLPFYLNQWDINEFRGSSFMGHNRNYLANLILIGILILLYDLSLQKVKGEIQKKDWIMLILSIPPIFFTASRTGISTLFVVLLIFAFIWFKNKITLITISLFSLLIITITNINIKNYGFINLIFNRFEDVENDPRFDLAKNAWRQVLENPVFGVGYDNFFSDAWRFSKDIVVVKADQTTVKVASVHNGFIDLGLMGGFPLMLSFSIILLYFLIIGFQKIISNDSIQKCIGAFLIGNVAIIIIFCSTGQANLHKHTWWQIGICTLIIVLNKYNVRAKLSTLSSPKYNYKELI